MVAKAIVVALLFLIFENYSFFTVFLKEIWYNKKVINNKRLILKKGLTSYNLWIIIEVIQEWLQ